MELLIKIPDEDYKFVKDLQGIILRRGSCKTIQQNVINAIKNGIPLPKGHGRLIDADTLELPSEELVSRLIIKYAPTIIEADKENDNETNS